MKASFYVSFSDPVMSRKSRSSVRVLFSQTREPHTVSFREPHPGDMIGPAILLRNIRKLPLKPDEFFELLKEC